MEGSLESGSPSTVKESSLEETSAALPGSSYDIQQPVNTGKVSLPDVFHVDTSLIPHAHLDEQVSDELRRLELNVYNQEDFEQNVMAQVDKAIEKEEEEKRKRILTKELKNVDDEIKVVKQELDQINKVVTVMESQRFTETKVLMRRAQAVRSKRDNKLKQLKKLKAKQKALNIHLYGYSENLDADDELLHEENQALSSLDQALNFGQEKKETEEQKMIRTGEMTPFGTVMDFNAMKPKTIVQPSTSQLSEFEQFLIDKDNNKLAKLEKQRERKKLDDKTFEKSAEKRGKKVLAFKTHSLEPTATSSKVDNKNKSGKRNLFDARDYRVYNRETDFSSSGFQGKTRYCPQIQHNFQGDPVLNHGAEFSDDDEWIPAAGTTFNPDDLQPNVDEDAIIKARILPDSWQLKKSVKGSVHEADDITNDDEFLKTGKCRLNCKSSLKRLRDDGNLRNYQKRIKLFNSKNAKRKLEQLEKGENSEEDVEFDGGLKVPGHMWTKLYKYQRTGVRWLWELHCQQAGGIIGDEMGLGKTIQTITFFASLSQSKLKSSLFSYVGLGPTIIVCPATVMHQWVREFHTWWPLFRVSILHSSGSFSGTDKQLIGSIVNCSGILITSYSTLVTHQDNIIHHKWHYVVLDEGHKIRNPNAQITVCCKQFRTPHRIILSGTPIQNNLKELWSLFDFVFPGKLGMLPDFMEHFSVPIVQGGYSNASQVQVQTAYKCACILRDTISPYLLRRMKSDVKVNLDLPNKNEQVLFCRLTHEQKDVYQEYLDSRECQAILNGQFKVFAGLITLRKICNHPDLSTGGPRIYTDKSVNEDEMFEYGFWKRSGKLIVVEALLRLWKQQGHRALLFSQSRAMLNIFEIFLKRRSYKYMKMDGTTSVSSRQPLINKFNSDPTIDLFLLTTRVGGLGVNLIGANRVIIFDPDWNPSTDTQARERAWRIGQTKQVTIYRLLTTGTIEEKIYHRQIFKQFLSNKVLKDPKQRRFFKSNELYELFTLGSSDKNQQTETSALFAGIGSDVCFKPKSKNRFDLMKEKRRLVSKDLYELDEEEKDKMRRFARELSKKIEREKNERLCNISQSSTVKSIDGVGNGLLGDSTVSEHHKKGKDSKPKKMSATMKFMGKKHSKCKSKKKQYKDAYFEGERIPNLVKQQEYKTPAGKREEDHSTFMDDYILKKLFKKSGVHSALKHDAVMNSSLPDFLLVEAEAEKIAKEAAKALKHSRSQCLNAMSGVPTWTGQISGKVAKPRFGQKKNSLLLNNQHSVKTLIPEDLSSGSPGSSTKESQTRLKHFDGKVSGNSLTSKTENLNTTMSSNELLARMRTRSLISNDDNHETKVNICGADVDLITNIRNYIAFQCSVDGKATTQELLDKYKTQLPPSDSAKFRSMLNQICDFDKIDGIGTWFLKLEFR